MADHTSTVNTKIPICPTCGQPAKLSAGKFGTKAECCGLWSWSGKSLVSGQTHAARIKAHAMFDRLWKSGQMTRSAAYTRLAAAMSLESKDCHIALMTADQANVVTRLVLDGWLDQDDRDAHPMRQSGGSSTLR